MSAPLTGHEASGLPGVLRIALALGHPAPEHLTSEQEGALLSLALLPEATCGDAARLTLRKTGTLDLVRWLRYAHFHQARQAVRDVSEEQLFVAVLVARAQSGARRRPRGRLATTPFRPVNDARPRGSLCVACGSVLSLGAVCGCRRSENAGRCAV